MNLYLIGYRGTGKSTVGSLVAAELELPWADLDQVIMQRTGKAVAQIFSEQGEAAFRAMECEELAQFDGSEPTVVSLGGGACTDRHNRMWLKQTGLTVWLTLPAEKILERLQKDSQSGSSRPPLTDLTPLEEIESVLAARNSDYASCANLILNTARMKPADTAHRICQWWLKSR